MLERIREAVEIADELRGALRIAAELKMKLVTLHAECVHLSEENVALQRKVQELQQQRGEIAKPPVAEGPSPFAGGWRHNKPISGPPR